MTQSKKIKIEISAQDKVSGVIGQIASKFEGLGNTASKVFEEINTSSIEKGVIALNFAQNAFGIISNTYHKYAQLEQLQGKIASLGIDDTGIKKITKAAKEFSNQWAGTTALEFIKSSYDIKSSMSMLSDEGVAQFTKLAVLTGKATQSSSATMTKLFALGHSIWSEDFSSDTQFGKGLSVALSSAIKGFQAQKGDLSHDIVTMGKQAKAMGVSMAEQFAIIGNAQGSFHSASEAMISYRSYLSGLEKAQNKLGLSFTHTSGELKGQALPMATVLDKIKNKYGDFNNLTVQTKIKEAFGSDDAMKIIIGLAQSTDKLRQSEKELHKEIHSGSVAKTEAMAKETQQGKSHELMQQRMGNLSASIGSMFAPAMALAYNSIGSVAMATSYVIDEFPLLAQGFGWVMTTATALTTVYSGVNQVMVTLRNAKNLLALIMGKNNVLMGMATTITTSYHAVVAIAPKIFGIAKTAIKGFGSVIKWAGKMMLTNPIGLAITGIAMAAGLIVTYWEPIKAFVSEWIGKIAGFISPVVDWIGDKFSWLIEPIKAVGNVYMSIFKWISDVALKFFNWIGEKFAWMGSVAKSIGSFFGFGGEDESDNNQTSKSKIGNAIKKATATTAVAATLSAPAYASSPPPPTQLNNQAVLQSATHPGKNITQNINIHLSVSGNPDPEALKEKIAHIARITFEEIRQDEQERHW